MPDPRYLSVIDMEDFEGIKIRDDEARTSIGVLSELKTTDKSSLVGAINDLYDHRDKLELVFVQDYLDLGQTATQAIQNAINDCDAKGTVIIPRGQRLEVTGPITINKPIKISGLDNGFNELEGGNNFTPYSDYIKASLKFVGGSIGFLIKSPSVEICNLVIEIQISNNFIAFKLDSETGDQLNMPRNIKLYNIFCWNLDLAGYNYTTYGVYSDKTTILSTFDHVLFGWFTYGFSFENNSVNTSLNFNQCRVTAQKYGYHINKGQYCTFINCSVESPSDTAAFYFDDCKSTALIGCFSEQIAAPNIILNSCLATVIDGYFCTTLPIIKAFLGTLSLNGIYSTVSGTADNPEVILNGANAQISGSRLEYIKQGNLTSHPVLNNKVVNLSGSFADTGVSISGATSTSNWLSQIDKTVSVGGIFDTSGTSFTITLPSALLPIASKFVGDTDCWAILQPLTATIEFHTSGAGSYAVSFDFESIASF